MSNPYLPNWEYIPDGEPRVFGDRIYIYGSHDRVASTEFCDYKLKVWSAPLSDLNNWTCHGHIFHSAPDRDHDSDTDWTNQLLFAPDVVYKDGKYYLYAYLVDAEGCVAVADNPWGPFSVVSRYTYDLNNKKNTEVLVSSSASDTSNTSEALSHYDKITVNRACIDPGVLVDDDGRVYIFCGFERSFAAELNPNNMYEILTDTIVEDIIPPLDSEDITSFFEACSPRKVGDTYYLIYSPQRGCRLAYATAKSPLGPYTYRGFIVDNGVDYPGGNNHGSIAKIGEQWYIFYHRTTNGTVMSRRGCVEPIHFLPDGSISTVEMTSQGFENVLNPYEIQPADIACVLKGGCYVIERNIFQRSISNIVDGAVIGYKYFDFGVDNSSHTMKFHGRILGMGCRGTVHLLIDGDSLETGHEIGNFEITPNGGVISTVVEHISGIHSFYLLAEGDKKGPLAFMVEGRSLFELEQFVFTK